MRPTLPAFLFTAGLLLGGVSLSGCKQEEGGRCELAGDCQAGLTCMVDSMGSGFCKPPGSTQPSLDAEAPKDGPAISTDAGTTSDAAVTTDAGTADGPASDAAPVDVAAADLAVEAGPADTATPLDASSN